MKKSTKTKEMNAADTLCAFYSINSTHLNKGRIFRADYLAVIEEDLDLLLEAVRLYYQIRESYHYCPRIICVDSENRLSRLLVDSVGDHNARLCKELGVWAGNILITPRLHTTADYVKAVADIVVDKKVIICLSRRYSGIFSATQDFVSPWLNVRYAVDKSFSVSESCHWYNARVIGHCAVMLQEIAALHQTFKENGGRSMRYWPKPLRADVISAHKLLRRRYHLLYPENIWQKTADFFRRCYYYHEIMRNRENIIASRNKALARFKQWLGRNDLVGPEEIKDIRPKNEDSAKKTFWHYHGNQTL